MFYSCVSCQYGNRCISYWSIRFLNMQFNSIKIWTNFHSLTWSEVKCSTTANSFSPWWLEAKLRNRISAAFKRFLKARCLPYSFPKMSDLYSRVKQSSISAIPVSKLMIFLCHLQGPSGGLCPDFQRTLGLAIGLISAFNVLVSLPKTGHFSI